MSTERMTYLGDFIDGSFNPVKQAEGKIVDKSPADLNDIVIEVPYNADHVDAAVAAAKKAYLPWARLSMDERKNRLMKLKGVFEAHQDELAMAIARDTGKPLWESKTEVTACIGKIDITVNHSIKLVEAEHLPNALPGVEGVTRFKPRGVMAVIGPFNFPAHLPNGHIVPALLMGNTVVYKPSEQTPAVGQLYAKLFQLAEFPAGVFNMIQGVAETGRKLVLHENVDGILFTGSYEVGLKIKQETLTHYWKILALEMGGKNATMVWDDSDMDKAVYETIVGAFMTSGQRCACTSRVFVHERIADEFTERFYQAAKRLSIGHWSENPFMGPLINESSVEKYLRFQEIAKRENCESLMRGKALDLKWKGHFVTPSINLVQKYDPNSIYQKSEIFGPNVSITKVNDFDETLDMVNSTGFGLVAALFTKNRALYEKALLECKVGLLNWNRTTNGASSKLPFGGMGKSGNDRASAHFAIDYCAVPVASLEDPTPFDPTKTLTGMNYPTGDQR
ncbi:MAG: succinylglutamate-semialdehyde dehydrogenase [Bdellovibrionaceae bacterium]|nr:succinylglutamate-semialdehyde dehydrogenase [Pseudobdellovibrionaceae bacterium]